MTTLLVGLLIALWALIFLPLTLAPLVESRPGSGGIADGSAGIPRSAGILPVPIRVGGDAEAVGRDLEEDAVRLTEVERLEVVAVDHRRRA